jgi:hypothetical protein
MDGACDTHGRRREIQTVLTGEPGRKGLLRKARCRGVIILRCTLKK